MALDSVPLCLGGDMGTSSRRKEERSRTTYSPYDDGHQWRKYGEKKLSNSNFPRFYYRCTYKNEMKCAATKQVQQKDSGDPPLFSVTYFNHHTCSGTSSGLIGGTRDAAATQSSSKKAVSTICFSSHSRSSEQPTFLTSAAAPPSPIIHQSSYRANHQFLWTATPSPTTNSPVKMEVANVSEASGSSSSTGALSRTLLPIGQSRCIEYFHFL